MSHGRGGSGKGHRSVKNKAKYERQFARTERNKARRAARFAAMVADSRRRKSESGIEAAA